MSVLGLALGLVMGLILGLLGGGGSILTVPIFVYVLDLAPKPAIAASLVVVAATSLMGALGHWRLGNVQARVGVAFGTVAMAGAYLGARLAAWVSGSLQLALFALVMMLAAYFMFRGRVPGLDPGAGPDGRAGEDRRRIPLGWVAVQGIAVGMLTGLVGVGGGFLIVPALVLLVRIPMKQAVGTSLAVITLNAAAGFVGYLDQVRIPWGVVAGFGAMSLVGISLGVSLIRFVPQRALRRAFALLLVVMGAAILYQNLGALSLP